MKPSWKDAPEWAQWLAMDGYGEWWWYESEPSLSHTGWFFTSGRVEQAYLSTPWQESLEPRP